MTFVWPRNVTSWFRKEVINFISCHDLYTADYDLDDGEPYPDQDITDTAGAADNQSGVRGVPYRLCSTSLTTVQDLAAAGGPNKAVKRTTADAVGRTILTGLYGYGKYVPAMACKPVETTQHIDNVIPEEQVIPYLVTKLLDRKDWRSNPKAMDAVHDEANKLVGAGTWDLSSVREYDDVKAEAQRTNSKTHFGNLMTICSLKFAEMAEALQRYKGRIVFRGDDVRDEFGAAAIFQTLSAQPTSVAAANANIAYGCMPGHKTTQADAVQAYVQSDLKGKHPTWVHVPKELWPAAWHRRGYKRPMCRLVKSLYGHPEAGGALGEASDRTGQAPRRCCCS